MKRQHTYRPILTTVLFVVAFLFFGSQSSFAASSNATICSNNFGTSLFEEHQNEDFVFQLNKEQEHFTESEEEISEEEKHIPNNPDISIPAVGNNSYRCLQQIHGIIVEFQKSQLISSLPKYLQFEVFRL